MDYFFSKKRTLPDTFSCLPRQAKSCQIKFYFHLLIQHPLLIAPGSHLHGGWLPGIPPNPTLMQSFDSVFFAPAPVCASTPLCHLSPRMSSVLYIPSTSRHFFPHSYDPYSRHHCHHCTYDHRYRNIKPRYEQLVCAQALHPESADTISKKI